MYSRASSPAEMGARTMVLAPVTLSEDLGEPTSKFDDNQPRRFATRFAEPRYRSSSETTQLGCPALGPANHVPSRRK